MSQGQLASPPCLLLKPKARPAAAPPQATRLAATSLQHQAVLVMSRRTVPAGDSGQICYDSLEEAAEGRAHRVCASPPRARADFGPALGWAPGPSAHGLACLPGSPGWADGSRTGCSTPLLSAFALLRSAAQAAQSLAPNLPPLANPLQPCKPAPASSLCGAACPSPRPISW